MGGARMLRAATIVLLSAGVVAGATGCPAGPPLVPPPCNRATERCARDLNAAIPGLTLGSQGSATDIADNGDVVVNITGYEAGAYRIPRGGTGRRLPGMDPTGATTASALTSHGLVAGRAQPVAGREARPVVWDAAEHLTDLTPKLPTFGGTFRSGAATDVNEQGQVVGDYSVTVDGSSWIPLVFLWDSRADTVTVLDPEAVAAPVSSPDAGWSVAIGDGGVVAGALV